MGIAKNLINNYVRTNYAPFFISHTFISNQNAEAELLLFENYLLSSSKLSSKNNRRYSKECTKNKYVCLNEVNMINYNENDTENEK